MRQINIILKHKRHIGSVLASAAVSWKHTAYKRKKTDALDWIESLFRVTALWQRFQMNGHSRAQALYTGRTQNWKRVYSTSSSSRIPRVSCASSAWGSILTASVRRAFFHFELFETANDPFFNTILFRSFIYDKCTFIKAENNSWILLLIQLDL